MIDKETNTVGERRRLWLETFRTHSNKSVRHRDPSLHLDMNDENDEKLQLLRQLTL